MAARQTGSLCMLSMRRI